LKRDQVFITNVVKCRPPGNRDPLPEELAACNLYLERQIEAINPCVIITLGRFSMTRFFQNVRISDVHGQARWISGR
jgi:uracil-DNA glycosylase